MADDKSVTVHATSVAFGDRGLLIRGISGSGKSGLALDLIALGAQLVSDDRTILRREGTTVIAEAPTSIAGRIEARGLGLLSAPTSPPVPVALVVDLDTEETERLPPFRETTLLGVALPLARKCRMPHFTSALAIYLRGERLE